MTRSFLPILFTALLASTLLTATPAASQTLYDDLGGQVAIECWIDQAIPLLVADERIGDFFAGDLNAGQPLSLRDSLVEFACAASGGPCAYTGRDMSCAHAGLAVDHQSFRIFGRILERAAVQCRLMNATWMNDPAYSQLSKTLL
ncbi:MAG: group 1 truncated hemoglobin, partial [Pseudomonadota bacterium]